MLTFTFFCWCSINCLREKWIINDDFRISREIWRNNETRSRIMLIALTWRDEIEIYFFQSQTTRRDREFFNQFSVFETRTRILYCYLSQKNHILSKFFIQKFREPRCRCYTTCTLLFHLKAFQSIARQCCGFSPVLSPRDRLAEILVLLFSCFETRSR